MRGKPAVPRWDDSSAQESSTCDFFLVRRVVPIIESIFLAPPVAMIPRRFWSGLTLWVALCVLFSLYFLWTHVSEPSSLVAPVGEGNPPPPPPSDKEKEVNQKVYKDWSKEKTYPPIEDNFPWGNSMQTRNDFPKIPSWNRPPAAHVKEKTPLFIGFTRSVCMPHILLLFISTSSATS
jgi:hypothetical protein